MRKYDLSHLRQTEFTVSTKRYIRGFKMKFPEIQHQSDQKEIERLFNSQTTCQIITINESGRPRVGVYNFISKDDKFIVHIGKKDEQTKDLERDANCLVVFQDILSVIPSFWIDERYGGAINNFFRYAEFECTSRIIGNAQEMVPFMQDMLDGFQSEHRYDPLDPKSEVYREKFAMLSIVELTVLNSRTKWNLGQAKPKAAFDNVIKQLEIRREGKDEITASEMKRWKLAHDKAGLL